MEKKVTGVKPIVKPAPVEKKEGVAGEKHPMYELCLKHMHRYVKVHTHDGCCYHGIVEHVDDSTFTLRFRRGNGCITEERRLRWIALMCRTAILAEAIPAITRAIIMAAIIRGITRTATTGRSTG